VFGSDAHSPEQVGRYFAEAAELARSVGYTHTLRLSQDFEMASLDQKRTSAYPPGSRQETQ